MPNDRIDLIDRYLIAIAQIKDAMLQIQQTNNLDKGGLLKQILYGLRISPLMVNDIVIKKFENLCGDVILILDKMKEKSNGGRK